MSLNQGQKDVIAARYLSHWKKLDTHQVALDTYSYSHIFSYLSPERMNVDRGTNKVFSVVVDREQAIRDVEQHTGMKTCQQIIPSVRSSMTAGRQP